MVTSRGTIGSFSLPKSLSDSLTFIVKPTFVKTLKVSGGSPGLVVMGADLCSEGREFESQHPLLDGILHI